MITILELGLLAALQAATPPALDTAAARRVFAEAARLAAADGKRLWGRSLAGPLVLVDPETRIMIGNEPLGGGPSAGSDGVYQGRLPADLSPANTAVTLGGRRWTMVMWPLPDDSLDRRQLLAHELWHRIQDSLGLPARERPNPQVDDEAGRVLLRLEARALARALETTGPERLSALAAALSFRGERHRLYPGADSAESMLERNEGLASYTGYRLSGRPLPAQRQQSRDRLARLETAQLLARSFAYTTGPAYGLLLDEVRPGWRLELRDGSGPAGLARRAVGVDLLTGPGLAAAEARYQGAAVRTEEATRAETARARRRDLAARFAAGALLTIPLDSAGFSFDPGAVEVLDSLGTHYGRIELTGPWGLLDATGGALIWRGFGRATVPVSAAFRPERAADTGWRLELKSGWEIVADSVPGRWRVARAQRGNP